MSDGSFPKVKEAMEVSPLEAQRLRAKASYGAAVAVEANIIRVLAENPKDYTGPGTNCYIVGTERLIIIDPGPRDAGHIDAVMKAVDGRPVKGIFVTHSHQDHSPAAATLQEKLGATIYGFGAIDEIETAESVDWAFKPDITLTTGQKIGSGDTQVEAIHTPGHFPNHLCYALPNSGVIFSGDHVMGWSTTAIVPPLGNLCDYMTSLDKLEVRQARAFLPSHGDVIADPKERIIAIREHRYLRSEQVRICLNKGMVSAAEITEAIYKGLTPRLFEAAKGCVEAHIEFLEKLDGNLSAAE